MTTNKTDANIKAQIQFLEHRMEGDFEDGNFLEVIDTLKTFPALVEADDSGPQP